MDPSIIQISIQQESTQEPAPRKRVRNWRNKLSQQTTPVDAATNNISEPDTKDNVDQKVKKLDVAVKTNTGNKKNEQNSQRLDVQTSSESSNTAIPNNNSKNSPKSGDKKSNQSPLKLTPSAKTVDQGSPKASVQAPPPVIGAIGSPKSHGQVFLKKLNDKDGSGSKKKRKRNKGAGSKKDTGETSNADFSKNDQKKNKEDMENQAVSTTMVGKNDADPSNSKLISENVTVEKYEVVEPMKEDIDNEELRITVSEERTKGQYSPNKYIDVTVVEPGTEQQITKDNITERVQPNSSDNKRRSVEDKRQGNQLEDIITVKKVEKKVEPISSNTTNDEAGPSETATFIKKFKELKVVVDKDDSEKNTQKKKVEIPVEKTEIIRITELQGTAKRGLPAGCLFVASLPSTKSDGDLQRSVWNHFSRWGILLNVKVLKDWLFRPYSFVQFENVCDARKALVEAHNTVIEGRHIRVEQARVNRTLFVGRLSRTMNEEDIRKLLEPYGATEDIHLLRTYSTGKSRGCAFVKFCYRDDAIRAYMNLRQHIGNYVIEWAANLEKAVPGPEDIDKRSIFIGQLNQVEVTKEQLVEKFSRYGGIKEVQYVVKNFLRTPGPPRSAFAFIYYNDEEASKRAIEAENNTKYFDRIIRVQYRESQEFRNQQIQLLRQQQEIRRKAFQESYYNAVVSSGRQSIRPPPLSRAQNYYVSQKTSIGQGRRNSVVIPNEMPIMPAPVFYPPVSMGVHQVGTNTNVMSGPDTDGNQEPKGKGPEVSHMQNNTVSNVSNMAQPELMYYPHQSNIPTSVGIIPAYAGSPQEGLAYPYAFMGTISHSNGTSYVRDGGHETTSATTSKAPPNVLHSYIPPYAPGQPVNEYGFAEVAGHSAQYCGVPVPIQFTMPPPMYFYPSPPMDPGYIIPYLQTSGGYEADIEIKTYADEEKTAVREIAKEEGSKVFDNEPSAI